jgi:hypothetical protein
MLNFLLIFAVSIFVAILVSFTRIFLHRLFSYGVDSSFFKEYTIFYSIGFIIMVSTMFYFDSVPLLFITFFLVIIAEALIFYNKYYLLESKGRYLLLLLISYFVVNFMVYITVFTLGFTINMVFAFITSL